MIANEAKNDFYQIITHEMLDMDRALADTIGATYARQIQRGMGQSGQAVWLLRQDATNSLKARGQFILGQLLRCLTAYHVVLNEENVAEATALLRGTIETQAQHVRQKLFGHP